MKLKMTFIIGLFLFATVLCKSQSSTLWGMTYDGGIDSLGVLFKYNLTGNTYTIVHTFSGGADGAMPQGSLIVANNGLLYGMAQYGGTYNYGILFSYNRSTGAYTKLHDFGGGTDGAYPGGTLMQASNGIIYGLTEAGGTYSNKGTIFSYDISTNTYTTLYNFGVRFDGISPVGSLIQASDGLLYGCTSYGCTTGFGSLFSYNISNGVILHLHNFDEGAKYPTGSVVQANNGLLYGLTWSGGNDSAGIIYSYDITSNTYTDVHDFSDTAKGINPTGSLIQASNGLLYGVTRYGGTASAVNGTNGIFFSYDIGTNTEEVIRAFGGNPDGGYPSGPLVEAGNGTIYGMTVNGGAIGFGFMFGYNIAQNIYSGLHDFYLGTDGANPFGGLVEVKALTAGENQLTDNTQLQISPNPSTGQFVVQLPGTQANYATEIYNMLGQKIEQLILRNAQNTLNLSNQPTGVYFVEVKAETGVVTGKVMVVK